MLERRRTVESIGLELAALRAEHTMQANVISLMADALFMSREERDMLALLQAEIEEVSAWCASSKQPPTSSAG